MYTIAVDHSRKIVRATLSGFFSEDEVAAFARDEQKAAASLRCPSGRFGLLVEAIGGVLQSQEVVVLFQRLLIDLPIKAGRVAMVCDSALLTLQLRRIVTGERTGVFGDVQAALAWIEEGLVASASGTGAISLAP